MMTDSSIDSSMRPARVVVLGTDALLAALPATPVQVVHACLGAGFDAAVPASWGDELVASACIRELATREVGPIIQCSCPLVARRLTSSGSELERFLLPLDPPPIAAARYVRALYGDAPVDITYAGGCPSGSDTVIDLALAPSAFLTLLAERGVSLGDQPVVFDSILPPDRRRHRSLPGGIPSPEALAEEGAGRVLIEIAAEAFAAELAEHLLEGKQVLLDVAPRLGCLCSGSVPGIGAGRARAVVSSLEPPRSPTPVVDPRMNVRLSSTPRDVAAIPERAPGAEPYVPPPADGWLRTADRRQGGTGPASDSEPAAPTTGSDAPGGRPRSLPRTYALTRATTSGRHRAVPDPMRMAAGHAVGVATPPVDREAAPGARDVRGAPESDTTRLPSLTPLLGRTIDTPADAREVPDEERKEVPGEAGGQASGQVQPEVPGEARPASPDEKRLEAPDTGPSQPAAASVADEDEGEEFDAFLADVRGVIADAVVDWRTPIRAAIVEWRARGYRVDVLERAIHLTRRPDVNGLLATFTSAVDHLMALEARALELAPELKDRLAGHPVFHDPGRVADAELIVQRLTRRRTPGGGTETTAAGAAMPDDLTITLGDAPPALEMVFDWSVFEERVIEDLDDSAPGFFRRNGNG